MPLYVFENPAYGLRAEVLFAIAERPDLRTAAIFGADAV